MERMALRPYQEAAKTAVFKYFAALKDRNPCVVLPTGAGKTPLLASICEDVVIKRARLKGERQRVLVVAHVKELLEQARDKLNAICPELNVGVYSAGLKSRDVDSDVIVAGIQSVYDRAFELGKFDVIIVDEAHLIPPDGDGMYQTLLKNERIANPKVRLVGLTATPYRLRSGALCSDDGFLNDVCYEIGVKDLIDDGYLCPVKSRLTKSAYDVSGLHIRGGEFVAKEIDELVSDVSKVDAACREVVHKSHKFERKKVLIFAANVAHAKTIQAKIQELTGEECGIVTGETSNEDRRLTLARFKDEPVSSDLFGNAYKNLRYLVNVNVLTTGFDNPKVDHVVLLRPTASAGLYYQMVGRGFRLHKDKDYCLISDYGQNIERHGPVDAICVKPKSSNGKREAPVKSCPKCELILPASARICVDCGHEFPFVPSAPDENITNKRSNRNVLSGPVVDEEYEVEAITYSPHVKTKEDGSVSRSMMVSYRVGERMRKSEWLCPEHQGFARRRFVEWWTERSDEPAPETVDEAIEIAKRGGLAVAEKIVVRRDDASGFDRIIKYTLGEIPKARTEELPLAGTATCQTCLCFDAGVCRRDEDQEYPVDAFSAACERYFDASDIPF